MTAKTRAARHVRFLEYGFFAPELPPAYNSEDLAKLQKFLKRKYSSSKKGKFGEDEICHYVSRPSKFRFPRFRNSDRLHKVINPVSFFALSGVLAQHYVELRNMAKKSKISGTPNIFDWAGTRALRKPNFEIRDRRGSSIAARFNYTLQTDVSAFYHSIYTHSIAWAIHGKDIAKKNRKISLVGNLIDLLVRNSQDSQTIGLPVGPDTSRMIAEVIAAAIDQDFQNTLVSKNLDVIRFVDDFIVGSQTRSDAEKALARIRMAANKYELELNNAKTTIRENTARKEHGWKDLIRAKVPKLSFGEQDLNTFFFEISELQQSQPDSNILKFGLRNARRAFVKTDAWDVAESYLMSSYRMNSTLIDTFVEYIIERHREKNDVNKENIKNFLASRIPALIDQNRSGEICWLIYLARCLSIKLQSSCYEGIFGESEPLLALQIADADKKSLIKGRVDYTTWDRSFTSEGLDDEMWLYAYEAVLSGYRKPRRGSKFIQDHKYFGAMFDKAVHFYKPDDNVPTYGTSVKVLKEENNFKRALAQTLAFDLSADVDDFEDFEDLIGMVGEEY